MNVLLPVIPPYVLGLFVLPSDQPLNVYPVSAIACIAVPVPRYVMNCIAVPLSVPHVPAVNCNVYVLIVKSAVYDLLPVIPVSILVIPV